MGKPEIYSSHMECGSKKKNNCGAHSVERGQACLTPTEEDLGEPEGNVGELHCAPWSHGKGWVWRAGTGG